MSREDCTLNMDVYMRAQCDMFLQSLQTRMITQVTNVINTVKTEMYQLIAKKAAVLSAEFESVVQPMDDTSVFSPLKRQRKRRVRKQKLPTVNTSVIQSVDATSSKRESNRNMFVEGRSSDASPDFAGAVPDIFLYRCQKDTEADGVKSSLTRKGVKIKSVDLISHVEAATRSFKVCVESTHDYDKLMSGDCIPRYVRVKEFIHFRRTNSDKSSWDHASIVNNTITNQVYHSNCLAVTSMQCEINEVS